MIEATLATESFPCIDLNFPLSGKSLPLDNGYVVFAALSKVCPIIHELKNVSIHPISGFPKLPNLLELTARSKLCIRLPLDQIPLIYSLAGKTLIIGENQYQLGFPQPLALYPFPTLYSRLVLIRRSQEPQEFLEVANRQLSQLGIRGTLSFLTRANGQPQRRQLTITNKNGAFKVKGFGLKVSDLNKEDSITLQNYGIGGKHKMMCGVFVPARRRRDE